MYDMPTNGLGLIPRSETTMRYVAHGDVFRSTKIDRARARLLLLAMANIRLGRAFVPWSRND